MGVIDFLGSFLPRFDSWQNALTGIGTSRDKAYGTAFFPSCLLGPGEIESLIHEDAIAARIVELPVKESFREGYRVKHPEADRLAELAKSLRIDEHVQSAAIWGRAYGGSLLILGVDDGAEPAKPLAPERVRAFGYLALADRRFAEPASFSIAPLSPTWGKAASYRIISSAPGTVGTPEVHASRCVRFDGDAVDARRALQYNGWSQSVLQRPYDAMRAFVSSYQSAGHLMSDASQGVYKIKELLSSISAAGGAEKVATRMRLLDASRSVARAIVLDSEEDFSRVATSFAGMPEMLDRFQQLLSAHTGIPVTKLFGRAPAGLNATGESDVRNWYDDVNVYRRTVLGPALAEIYSLLCRANGINPAGLEIEWPPLWQPTELEQEQAKKVRAERDAIYAGIDVLLPGQIALARFGEGKGGDVDIDEALAKAQIDSDADMLLNPPEPPPPGDPNAPPSSSEEDQPSPGKGATPPARR